MTVAKLPRINEYQGVAGSMVFPVKFQFLTRADLSISLRDAHGFESLVDDSRFTVDGGGGETGSVSFASSTSGYTVVIRGRTEISQKTEYPYGSNFPSAIHERAVDRAAMIDQEQQDQIDDTRQRALMVPFGQEIGDIVIGANTALTFDANKRPVTKPIGSFPAGPPGPSNNTRIDLDALKSASVHDLTSLYDGSLWFWQTGDYTELADDLTIVASNYVSPSLGAWLRITNGVLLDTFFGAVGDGITDDGPALRRMIAASRLLGDMAMLLTKSVYAVRMTVRTGGYTGHGFVIEHRAVIRSAVGKTRILFKAPNGGSLETNIQNVGGSVWRGSGFFIRGSAPQGVDPGYPNRNALRLENIEVLGGCSGTGNHGEPTISNPDGWDQTNKGIFCEADHYIGDIELYNSSVIGFKGEVLFGAGVQASRLVCRNVMLGESNANLINMTRESIDIDGILGYFAYSAFEGWGGRNARIVNFLFRDILKGAGRFQGGKTAPGSIPIAEYPTRWVPTERPVFELRGTFLNCGTDSDQGKAVKIGAFVTGEITAIDTVVMLSCINNQDLISDIDLTIHSIADQFSFPAVAILGGADNSIRNARLRINCDRTSAAVDAGRAITKPLVGGGGIGNTLIVEDGRGDVSGWPQATFLFTGGKPVFRGNKWRLITVNEGTQENIGVNASMTIDPRLGYAILVGAGAGPYDIGIGTAGWSEGAELRLYCSPGNSAQFRFNNAGNIRLRVASYSLSGRIITFVMNGGKWCEQYVENWASGND